MSETQNTPTETTDTSLQANAQHQSANSQQNNANPAPEQTPEVEEITLPKRLIINFDLTKDKENYIEFKKILDECSKHGSANNWRELFLKWKQDLQSLGYYQPNENQ